MLEPDATALIFRQWFQEEWRAARPRAAAPIDDFAECCPVSWLMPELLELIARTHDQPVATVRHEIRRLILEQDFNDMSGDAVVDAHHREVVDQYVDLLTRTVERVRRRARQAGQWSEVPAPSQFFG